MYKKITTLVASAALSFFLLTNSSLADEPITIKFSHVVAENTPKGLMANKFRDLVKV